MEIKSENARIWRKEIEGKNGTFYRYSTGVSSKAQDGSYINAYIDVLFSKKSGAPEKIKNGATCDFEGFMGAKQYKDKDGKTITSPQIIIMSVNFLEDANDTPNAENEDVEDSFEEAEDDIPF